MADWNACQQVVQRRGGLNGDQQQAMIVGRTCLSSEELCRIMMYFTKSLFTFGQCPLPQQVVLSEWLMEDHGQMRRRNRRECMQQGLFE